MADEDSAGEELITTLPLIEFTENFSNYFQNVVQELNARI